MATDKTIKLGHPSYVWGFGQERRLDLIRRFVDLEGKTILDAGCGIGIYVRAFRRFSQDVHGVDIDPERVEAASQDVPNILVAPAESLPYPDGSFDVVLSHEVIEHVSDDRQAIAEAIRVLKRPEETPLLGGEGAASEAGGRRRGSPGGRLVIFAPNRLYPFETHGAYWRGRYHFGNIPLVNYLPACWRKRFCPHVRAYTVGDLRRLLAGHDVRIVVHTQIFPGYDKVLYRRAWLGRLLRRVTYLMERTPLRLLGLSHFIVVERVR